MTPLLAPRITIVDIDSGVSLAEIQRVAAALQIQVRTHFAPAWGVGAEAVVTGATASAPGDWRLELRKVPTVDGALGYHDETTDGVPMLYVFPELCAQDGTAWSSCASHEVLEALADPFLRRLVMAPDGRIFALEICDQVESDTYEIDGIAVSNFNLPANFEPPSNLSPRVAPAYDFMRLQTSPLEVRPGGYEQVFASGTGWQQITNYGAPRRYRRIMASLGLSRGRRRAAIWGMTLGAAT